MINPAVSRKVVMLAALLVGGLASQGFAEITGTSNAALKSVRVLNHAWNLENNAMLRSRAFARKADEEGYGSVASLFRAIAQSQQVHTRNRALALKKLGYQPEVASESLEVRSTAENLRAETAVQAGYQRAAFPNLIASLQREHFRAALRSVSYASFAETSFVDYLGYASEHLRTLKKSAKTSYYVCQQCGYLTKSLSTNGCKVCYHLREKHVVVS